MTADHGSVILLFENKASVLSIVGCVRLKAVLVKTQIEGDVQRRAKGARRKGKERKGKERKGKERKGKERKGKERKGKERKGMERKGKHERY